MADELVVLRIRGDSDSAERDLRELTTLLKRMGTEASRSSRTSTQASQRQTRATQQQTRATRERERQEKRLGTTLRGAARYAAGAAAAYVGLSQARQAVTATTDLAKATLTLTKNLDLGARTASEFSALAFTRGADARSLGMAFNTLSGQVRGARNESKSSIKIFEGLGISMEELRRSSPEEMLFKVSDGLNELGPGFARADAQRKLFGRGAATLTPILRSGSDELRTQMADARELGATFSELGLRDMEDVIAAQRRMQLAQLGLQISFTQVAAPAIKEVTGELADMSAILRDKSLTGDEKADAISQRFAELLEKLAEQAATHAPRIATAFVKGFLAAPIMGQVVTGGLLLARFGGIGAFTKMGGDAGTGFGKGFAGKAVPAAAAGAIGLQLRDEIKRGMEAEGGIWADLNKADDKIWDLSANVAALNPLGAAKKNLEGLLELGDDGPSSAEKAVARLTGRLDKIGPSVRKAAGITDQQMAKIENAISGDSAKGAASMTKQFDAIVRQIRQSMKNGEISTREGMDAIKEVLREKNAQLNEIGAGGKLSGPNTPGNSGGGGGGGGWQRGGMPGLVGVVPGIGSGDKVPLQAMVEPGEGVFIMNRNAMGALAEFNASVPRFKGGGAMIAGKSGTKGFDPSLPNFSGSGFPALGTVADRMNETSDAYERLLRQAQQQLMRRAAASGPAGKMRSYPRLSGDTDFTPALGEALSAMARKAGTNISVTSGWRSRSEQAALYAAYLNGTGNLAAPPGQSNHEDGRAADISPGRETFGNLASQFGLSFAVPSESWHIELAQRGGLLGLQKGGAMSPVKGRGSQLIDGGSRWDANEAATLLWQLGASPSVAGRLSAKVAGESSGDPRAVGNDPGGTTGLGLWQITTGFNNDVIARFGGREAMFDPVQNARAALTIYARQGIGAWYAGSGSPGSILRDRIGPDATTGALKAAAKHKVDLARVKGSGPKGRITRNDVHAYIDAATKGGGKKKKGSGGSGAAAAASSETSTLGSDMAASQYADYLATLTEAQRLYSADRALSMRLSPVIAGFAKREGIDLYGPYAEVPELPIPAAFASASASMPAGGSTPATVNPASGLKGGKRGAQGKRKKGTNTGGVSPVQITIKGDIGKHVKAEVKGGIKASDRQIGRAARRISYSPG